MASIALKRPERNRCRSRLEQGVNIDNAIMALSTYVGHVEPKSTYWYMEAVPELMALTSARFESSAQKVGIIDHA